MGRARTGTQFGLVPVRQDNGVPGQRSGGGESCVFDIGLVYEGQAGLEREQPARRFSEIRAGKTSRGFCTVEITEDQLGSMDEVWRRHRHTDPRGVAQMARK